MVWRGKIIYTSPSWGLLGLFALSLAFMGGSSRFDVSHIAVLRPICALFLIPACYCISATDLRRGLMPAFLLSLSGLWMALQLVPLPPELWANLADRQVIAEIDEIIGLGDVWRPLSLAPFRGLNALTGLVVPVSAMALAIAFKANPRQLFILILGIGLVDASFAILQVIVGPGSPLDLFAVSSRGVAAGVFANENHSAVFSAIALLATARLALVDRDARRPGWLITLYAGAFVLVFLAILVSGSRAGLFAGLVALCATALMVWRADGPKAASKTADELRKFSSQRVAFIGFFCCIAILVGTFLWAGRTPAFRDLFGVNAFEDLRWAIWPTLVAMMENHWLLGTGIGSFDVVYNIYEPTALLLPAYVNQAHNDWAQIVIEGGLPAVILLSGLLLWLGMTLKAFWADRKGEGSHRLIFWLAVLVIIGGASIVDYPMRTPIFQAVAVWLLLSIGWDRRAVTR